MSILASLLLSSVLLLRPETDLRVLNPHAVPADATLICNGEARKIRLDSRSFMDVAGASGCTAVDSLLPLTLFETRGNETQRVLGSDAACDAAEMYAPLFACNAGTGTAAVPVTEGATYAWTVEGASITAGAGTPRVTLAFGDAGNVKLTCVIATPECTRTASGVIAVRPALTIAQVAAPAAATTGTPLTITWTVSGTPVSQLLTGDALEAPVQLSAEQRTYTFTPKKTGSREIEIRASYLASLSTDTARGGKRRAVGRSVAGATECAVATAARRIDISGCSGDLPEIIAQDKVDAGEEFYAAVELEPGETAQWSIDNGTLLSDTTPGTVLIRAGASGDVIVNVRVVRGACSREASRAVQVTAAAVVCGISPVATVSLVSYDCDRARVRATFTGTPPFRGKWSDGVPFETSDSSLQRDFDSPGAYGIGEFRDATCIGVSAGGAQVDAFRGRATLTVEGGSCANGTLVANLEGTPPFSFVWSGPGKREWVTTSEHVVRRPLQADETGDWYIEAVSDATCPRQSNSNHIGILHAPEAYVLGNTVCSATPGDELWLAAVVNGPGPYSVTWSDGVVTDDSDGYIGRRIPGSDAPAREYSMVSAKSGVCNATLIGDPKVKVFFRRQPRIDNSISGFDPLVCPGETGTAHLTEPPPPGSTIEWTVPGGEILTGQGSASVTFRGTSVSDSLLRATAVYPDGACATFDHVSVRFHGIPNVTDFRVEPSTIKAGGTATLKFTIDSSVDGLGVGVVNAPARQSDLVVPLCTTRSACTATYTDTQGAGTVQFELQYFNECINTYKSAFTTLTITP
jgi:hypothetical protein